MHIIQIYSGITCGRVLNGELHAQRLQKLIYLYLFTDCFMICSDDWREIFMKQSVKNTDKLTFIIFAIIYVHKFAQLAVIDELSKLNLNDFKRNYNCFTRDDSDRN